MLIGADALERATLPRDELAALAARATCEVAIDVAGIACATHFDDAAAAALFARRYADLRTTAAPQLHAYAVAEGVDKPLFWSGGGLIHRWPHGALDAEAIAFLADAVAVTAFFRERLDALSFHAATVGIPGAAASVAGDTHAGKTTTAIACARSGMQLFSDERCVIVQGRVVAFPRALSVRAGGAAVLGDAGGARSDVRFGELVSAWERPAPAPLRAVFLLAGFGARASLERASRREAIGAVVRWTHCAGDRLDAVARLLDAFRDAACYRLVLGTPAESAALIARTLA